MLLGFLQAILPSQKSYLAVVSSSHESSVNSNHIYVTTIFGKADTHVFPIDASTAGDVTCLQLASRCAMV